jgi:hypothetical protein
MHHDGYPAMVTVADSRGIMGLECVRITAGQGGQCSESE